MTYKVPFVDPRKHYASLKAEIDGAIQDCLENGDLVCRHQLKEYEQSLADFVGTKHAIGVNSGYDALHLSLVCTGIGAGDEVITVAHTFVATISAIVHCGATPVLVDVGEDHNMDVDGARLAITERTRAIIPVHLNGRLCDMVQLMLLAEEHDLLVIEDAAQALGSALGGKGAGSFGHTGCFSHYPFKSLGAFGDGGALTTDDPRIDEMARRLRYNGEDRETGDYHHHGYTCLLDNVQAAVLRAKLPFLPGWIERRRDVSERYRAGLEGVGDLQLPHYGGDAYFDVFQNYVITTKARDALADHLRSGGVELLIHWPKPWWEHPGLNLPNMQLPRTEQICREVLSLPMNVELEDGQVDYVIQCVRAFFE